MRFTMFCRGDTHSNEICTRILKAFAEDKSWQFDDQNPQLIICVGGDGTLLRAIHAHLSILDQTCFVALHTGTLGFLTDYTDDELVFFIDTILHGNPRIEKRRLLEFELEPSNEKFYALNEVRIGSFFKTIALDIEIDGEFFEHTSGSGVCISTQAGSTAANRALMGAVVDNGLEVLQLCEIMPVSHKSHHSLRNPYIMRSDRKLLIKGESLMDCDFCYDHLETKKQPVTAVKVRLSEREVNFARYRPYSNLKRLKNLY